LTPGSDFISYLRLILDDGMVERGVAVVVCEVDDAAAAGPVGLELAVADGGHQLDLALYGGGVQQSVTAEPELGIGVQAKPGVQCYFSELLFGKKMAKMCLVINKNL
jgi:hypothetical protein